MSFVENMPHDAAAIVVYVMILIFVGFIVHGSRTTKKQG